MKFVTPDLRVGESVHYWQEDPSWKMVEGGDYCCQSPHGGFRGSGRTSGLA